MRRTIWLTMGLALLGLLLCGAALADASGACGPNATWALSDAGALTISGTGDMSDGADYGDSPWNEVKDSVKEIVVQDGVTSVGAYQFWFCENATKVTLGKDIARIGKAAFVDCTKLTAIQLPESVQTIDDWAFAACESLTRAYIPASVNSIGEKIFGVCDNLTDIYFAGTRTAWERLVPAQTDNEYDAIYYATIHLKSTAQDFRNGVEETAGGTIDGEERPSGGDDPSGDDPLPEGVIAQGTCGARLKWTLDSAGCLTITGSGTMENYARQTDIHYDSSGRQYTVTYYTYPWGGDDLAGRIIDLEVEEGVTTIGNMAFAEISSLKTAALPTSLTSVVYGASYGTGLTDVYYAGSQADWRSVSKGQYNGPLNDASFHWNATGPEAPITEELPLRLPNDLQEIQEAAFAGGGFTHVYLGNRVKTIGSRAFANCKKLVYIHIPDSVTSIADDAFSGSTRVVIACSEGSAAARYAARVGLPCDTTN